MNVSQTASHPVRLAHVREWMNWQDDLPKAWRELVYEFGQVRVHQIYEAGISTDDARDYLT